MPEPDVLKIVADRLSGRLQPDHLTKRLRAEQRKESRPPGPLRQLWRQQKRDLGRNVIGTVLKATLMRARGQSNLLQGTVNEREVVIDKLPPAFNGFRVLHLSDLHLDMHPQLADVLIDLLKGVPYDICVITGDFRARTFGPIEPCLQALQQVRAALDSDIYCVLGNHDSLRMLPSIEAMDMSVLMNETVMLKRESASLALIGVDDPHYFRTDNLSWATRNVPADVAKILLVHSPEIWREAAEAAIDLYLCGHTHGGQICLPGQYPLFVNARAPRAMAGGAWHHGALQGYTSRGSGASVVAARFNCPPEITVHTLRAG
ncbi:MAG: metallophosphoesterase [Burkholderiaceae bacterium]